MGPIQKAKIFERVIVDVEELCYIYIDVEELYYYSILYLFIIKY